MDNARKRRLLYLAPTWFHFCVAMQKFLCAHADIFAWAHSKSRIMGEKVEFVKKNRTCTKKGRTPRRIRPLYFSIL